MVDFDRLPPSDQGVRVVIDAVLRSYPPDRAWRSVYQPPFWLLPQRPLAGLDQEQEPGLRGGAM